jgi:PAS domain S-box-containing protein
MRSLTQAPTQPLDAERFVARLQQLHQIAASESLESHSRLEAFVRLGIEAFDARAGLLVRALEFEAGLEEPPVTDAASRPPLEVKVWLELEALSLRTVRGTPDAARLALAGLALEVNGLAVHADRLSVPVIVHRHTYGCLDFFGLQHPNWSENDAEFLKLLAHWISHELERDQAEGHLRERTEQLNAVIEVSPDGILIMDHSGHIIDVNPALLEMTGLERDALVGATGSHFEIILGWLADPVAPSSSGGINSHATDPHANDVVRLVRPGPRVLKRTQRPMRDPHGQVMGEVIYFRDITFETEISRLKSEFLSSAAHELRTPMASVYGFAELLLTRDFDEATRRDLIATIHRQSGRLVKLMNDLLDLSRIEERAGKELYILEHDLECLILTAMEVHVPSAEAHRFALTSSPPGHGSSSTGPSGTVYADEDKFRQVLGHLIANAIIYAPTGPIEIAVVRSQNAPDMLGVEVRDCGIGMSELETSQAFDRFFRADTSGQTPGTGLGLSLVREIMRLHAGEVRLESQPGTGTTVGVWFPTQLNPNSNSGANSSSRSSSNVNATERNSS